MSEFKMSPDAASALNDFFDYMGRAKTGPMASEQDILDRAQDQAVACTALVSYLMNAYGPATAVEISTFAAQMLLDITGDEESAAAAAECAMMHLDHYFADTEATEPEITLPNIPITVVDPDRSLN